MAKYKYKKKTSGYTEDSTLRKLKTVFEDQLLFLTRGNVASDVRGRVMDTNFATLRNIAHRLSPANMCINCREQQVAPFLRPAKELGDTGYIIRKKGKTLKRFTGKDKRGDEISDMVNQTGFIYDPNREDDFMDFGKMFVRELLTIDQVSVELQRNRRGEIGAFWLLDGSTIARCFEDGYAGNKKIAFVQEIDQVVRATYSREDIIFDYMFKRADLRYRGYGYSLLEQSIDLVTTLILGISYNRDIFIKDKMPKGFIALQGEADRETIEAVERYWYMAMSGAGNKFKIPILPSGKDGVSMDFKTLGQTNRDMEYHKLMLFFLSLFGAVFGIDLAELGIKTDNTQQVMGENVEGRIQYSKSRGLNALLSFLETFMNKIIRKIDEEYVFEFVGIDPEDDIKKYEIAAKAIATTRTPNEMRKEDGLEEKPDPEYDDIMNPTLLQFKQFYAAQQQQQEEGGEEDWGEEEWDGNGSTNDDPNKTNNDNEDDDSTSNRSDTNDNRKENNGGKEDKNDVNKKIEKAIAEIDEHLEELKKSGYDVDVLL